MLDERGYARTEERKKKRRRKPGLGQDERRKRWISSWVEQVSTYHDIKSCVIYGRETA